MFGALLALLAAADAISGERERGTLESLLLTPVPRRHLVSGKLLAALSLWFAALIVAVPYIWFLGRDVGAVDDALAGRPARGNAGRGLADGVRDDRQRPGELQPPQPLGEPVRAAGAVRARRCCPAAPSRAGRASCCSA